MKINNDMKVGKRIYLTSVCGSGKSTFVEKMTKHCARIESAGNIAEKCLENKQAIDNILKQGYSKEYARQSTLYHHTKEMMIRRNNKPTIQMFERTIFDWLVGGLLCSDPMIRSKFQYFERHLASSLEHQKVEFWDRTRFYVIPSPSLAVLENQKKNYLTGKRNEWYENSIPGWSSMSETRKLRTLHESMIRTEFEIYNSIKRIIPDDANDCELVLIRDLPAYAGKELDVRTYFQWQEVLECVMSNFVMEY